MSFGGWFVRLRGGPRVLPRYGIPEVTEGSPGPPEPKPPR